MFFTNQNFLRRENVTYVSKTAILDQKMVLFWLHGLISSYFFVKATLPQCEIFTICVTFRALSDGTLENKEKVVQQDQKLKILVNSIRLP